MESTRQAAVGHLLSASQAYLAGAIGAVLYVALHLASIPFVDWTNIARTNTPTAIFVALANLALIPVVYALYRHLSAASSTLSAVAAGFGVLAVAGAITIQALPPDTLVGAIADVAAFLGYFVWLGSVGYLGLMRRLLSWPLASLSIALALLFPATEIVSRTTGETSAATGLMWSITPLLSFIWAIWLGIELFQRGRHTPMASGHTDAGY